jgi:CRISPR system Cascade subunit CasD
MQAHLLLRLYAPLASWGDIAVGEQRPTLGHPTRSAIIGLLSAALGLRRDQTDAINHLASGLATAVRIDNPGETVRDYHTTQVPRQQRKLSLYTRKDELGGTRLHTILSQRDYRSDALYAVALWNTRAETRYPLERLRDALLRPKLAVYLGRKSCPPALPMQPQIIQAATLKDAFDNAVFNDELLAGLPPTKQRSYAWEQHPAPGMKALQSYPRRDNPTHRLRWQFSNRVEFLAIEPRQEQP